MFLRGGALRGHKLFGLRAVLFSKLPSRQNPCSGDLRILCLRMSSGPKGGRPNKMRLARWALQWVSIAEANPLRIFP